MARFGSGSSGLGQVSEPSSPGAGTAVVVERGARDRVTVLPAADLRLPDLFAGLHVEGHDIAIEMTEENFAAADRDAAIVPPAADGADVLLNPGFALPDQRAGFAVERKHVVIPGSDVHDSVFDDRRAFEGIFRTEAGPEMCDPGPLEIPDIVAIDLGQPGITAVGPIAPGGEPFLAGRLPQIRSWLCHTG